MEEDIKILENLKEDTLKACKCSLASSSEKEEWKKEVQAIENLINRVKELEEENTIYALEGKNIKLEHHIKDNYIPKSKIREKIEEHKKVKEALGIEYKTTKYEDEGKRIRNFYMIVSEDLIVQALQELLEG